MSYFILGLIGGVCIANLAMVAYLLRQQTAKTAILDAEREAALKTLSETHSNVVGALQRLENKQAELSTRLDMRDMIKTPSPVANKPIFRFEGGPK